ncbi:MAG: protelomerase family protein [Leptolyngbyaceae cyanobacterium]
MPRKKWLEPLLDDYLVPRLKPLSPDDITVAQAIALELRQHWDNLGFTQMTQHKDLMHRTRKHLARVLPDNHVAFDALRLTPGEYAQANQVASQRVQDRNQVQAIVSPHEVNAIVTLATKVIGDHYLEWPDWAAALALLTGRRLIELFTATLEPANAYSVWVSGLAKRPDDEIPLKLMIPVLCQAEYVLAAFERLRHATQAETLTPTIIDKKIGPQVLNATRSLFQPYVTVDLSTHVLRDLYGAIATFFYCPSHTSSHEFQAHCLAHYQPTRQGDRPLRAIAANRNYDRFSIQDNGIIRKGIRLSRPDVQVIPDFQIHEMEANATMTIPDDLSPFPLLTAALAFKLAQERGWQQSKTSLLSHAKKRPIWVAQEYGLCYDPLAQRKPGDNRTPTWRDLWGEPLTDQGDEDMAIQAPTATEDRMEHLANPSMTEMEHRGNPKIAGAIAPIESKPYSTASAAQETTTMTLALLDRIQQLTTENTKLHIELDQIAQQSLTSMDPDLLAEVEQLRQDNQSLRQQNQLLKQALSLQAPPPQTSSPIPSEPTQQTSQTSADKNVVRSNNEVPMVDPINRAIYAIFDWNNTPGRPHRQKWPISFPVIMELLRANGYAASQKAIKAWFDHLDGEIKDHYQQHGLSKTQSRFHKDKISDCISL